MDLNLNDNQTRFVRESELHGYAVDFEYGYQSIGEICPAVRIKQHELAKFVRDVGAHFSLDNRGKELVVYARP